MGCEGVVDLRSYSSNITTWKHARKEEEDWCDVWHGRLIITPDGTAKQEEYESIICSN